MLHHRTDKILNRDLPYIPLQRIDSLFFCANRNLLLLLLSFYSDLIQLLILLFESVIEIQIGGNTNIETKKRFSCLVYIKIIGIARELIIISNDIIVTFKTHLKSFHISKYNAFIYCHNTGGRFPFSSNHSRIASASV